MATSPTRSAFEASLLRTAHYFARAAQALDADGSALTPGKRQDRQALVIGAILTSVSFLEATLNAAWDDLGKLNGLPRSWFRRRRNLACLAELGLPDNLRLPLLTRFDLTLAITNSKPLDPAVGPYQDNQGLILLRNAISHRKPEWELADTDGGRTLAGNLERRLHGKFKQDRAWKGSPPFFPNRCLSSDCARWAVASAQLFALKFFSLLGVRTIALGVILTTLDRLEQNRDGA